MSSPPRRVAAYYHASDLPAEFWAALRLNEPVANIILPFAIKALNFPRQDNKDQLWIILYDDAGNDVEFVLSCTRGLLGNYPVFIYTPKSSAQLTKEEERTASSLLELILCLLREVRPQRVFSVFAFAKVAKKFAKIFQERTYQHGIRAYEKPYYDATFILCTNETINNSSVSFSCLPESEDFLIALRRADTSDLEGVRALCKGFSDTSPPYELSYERAQLEAEMLIDNQQAYVHMIKKGNEDWETACLVATTRESENVTAVTKVFTAEQWRGHGCAARLLHRVCQDIVHNGKIVVLYVGNSAELANAHRVYDKVGFRGLNTQQEQQAGIVEKWLEIGFEGTELGYW